MPGEASISSQGLSAVFGTSGFNAQITAFSFSGEDEIIDVTHLSVLAHNDASFPADNKLNRLFKKIGLSSGDITLSGFFNSGLSGSAQQPYLDEEEEVLTITFPLGSGDTTKASIAFNVVSNTFEITADLGDVIKFSMGVKATGNQAITAAT